MGLTIHYSLCAPLADEREARRIVELLRARACTLGVGSVSKIIEMPHGEEDPARGLLAGTVLHNPAAERETPAEHVFVEPLWAVLFAVELEGSESFRLGLARFPAVVSDRDAGIENFATGLADGCHWQTFCKTQFASLPSHGGVDHFLRVHKFIVAMLDYCRDLGLTVDVTDEGGYWETRNEAKLRTEVEKMNGIVAAFTGRIADRLGRDAVASPIMGEPSFERLEARGQEHLSGLEGQLQDAENQIDRALRDSRREEQ